MKATISRLWKAILPYKWLSLLTLVLIAVQISTDLMIPRLIQRIIDEGIRQKDLQAIVLTSVLMLGLSVFSCALAIASSIASIRISEGVGRDFRKDVFLKVQSFSYANLDKYSTGELMVRISSDVSAMQRMIHMSLRMGAKSPLMIIGSIVMMFITAPSLAVWVVPVMLLAVAVVVTFSLRMEPAFRTVQERLDRLNTVLQENIAGAELIKSFDRAEFEEARFDTANTAFAKSSIRVMQFMNALSPLLTFSVNLAIAVIIWLGGGQAITGKLSTGQVIAFVNYMLALQVPMVFMINMANNWANGMASGKRIEELMSLPLDVVEPESGHSFAAETLKEAEFDSVSFSYHTRGTQAVLEEVKLQSQPGQIVAILGATGAGKSTLINLLPRFYDPEKGSVRINGIDLRAVQQSTLLSHIGMVPQETILFSGTIRDNLKYGRPEATDKEMEAAAKAAQIHEFIAGLPEGYNTQVEERGANFSGGQKQRLAIARALTLQPDYLILDDSTSAVDVETEAEIQNAIRDMMRGKTIFMVAQRISTVLNADKIIVLDHGKVAAEGTHRELMSSSLIYREIYESQLGGAAL